MTRRDNNHLTTHSISAVVGRLQGLMAGMSDRLTLESTLPPLLTTPQAAKLIGCGERTLWRWSRSGIAPAPVKIGGTIRYRRDELLEWIANGCPPMELPPTIVPNNN
jgi:excisionase family DNA binding protein